MPIDTSQADSLSLRVRVLGCGGAIANGARTTSFLVNDRLLVDAGTGVCDLSLDEMVNIRHVVLTHSHLDHIACLPLMLDAVGARRGCPLQVHALPETLAVLRTHVFNDVIWPDFTRLPQPEAPFVTLHPLAVGQRLCVGEIEVEALPASHTVPAVGYALALSRTQPHWVFSGDTGGSMAFWHRVNQLPVGALVIETAFSDREAHLAHISQHLCPATLATELEYMSASCSYPVFISHMKPAEAELIMHEVLQLNQFRLAQGRTPLSITALETGHQWVL